MVTRRSWARSALSRGPELIVSPTAALFDTEVAGPLSRVVLNVRASEPTLVLLVEWVVEAGGRVWIVLYVREALTEPDGQCAGLGNKQTDRGWRLGGRAGSCR